MIWKTAAFWANDKLANGEASVPPPPGFTLWASPFRMAATCAEKLGTNGVDSSIVAIRTSTTPASTPPGSAVLTPCASDQGSEPGSTKARRPLTVSWMRSGAACAASSQPRALTNGCAWMSAAVAAAANPLPRKLRRERWTSMEFPLALSCGNYTPPTPREVRSVPFQRFECSNAPAALLNAPPAHWLYITLGYIILQPMEPANSF